MPDSTILFNEVAEAAKAIRSADDVLIVSHIDADGITAAAIAASVCQRLGKEYRTVFLKKLGDEGVEMIDASGESLVWICDLGSGSLSSFNRGNIVITDHHVPNLEGKKGQMSLDVFADRVHVNPHDAGLDGSVQISGAGVTYLVAKEVDPRNTDLAYLAVVGACGDVQDSEGRLVGLNRSILNDAIAEGSVEIVEDLRLFGRETRTLIQYLQYGSEPSIPGLSENGTECARLYASLDVPLKDGKRFRNWNDLSRDEKDRVTDAVLARLSPEDAERAVGESYTLCNGRPGTELRDAKEYATLLNACGRYGDAETGMRICLGEPSALSAAKDRRAAHKQNISSALSMVKEKGLLNQGQFIQWFDAGSEIQETVVGIVAGMLLNGEGAVHHKPMIAFADAEDGVKVSARADRSLVARGLDLSFVMRVAAESVGGFGGGHSVAAGATIPPDRKRDFLNAVEDIVAAQVI